MPRPALVIVMVSITLCCFATIITEKEKSMEITTQLHVNVTPVIGLGYMETTSQLHMNATPVSGPKCGKPPGKENAIFLGNWDQGTYPQGYTVTYSCRPGYVMSRKIKLVCLDGKWESLLNGYCIKRSCGHPGDIPYGTFELRNEEEFVFGAVVEYSCDQGYQMMSRQKSRTCAADGWTNQPPHCAARLCPPVWDDSVQVLTSVTDDEFTMGQAISFKCRDPRLRLKGPTMIYCTENGTWNSDPPTCKYYIIPKRGSCTVHEDDMRKNNIQLKDSNKLRFEDNENVQFECVSRHNISDPTKLIIRCNNGILKYPTCNKTVSLDRQLQKVTKNTPVGTPCGRPPQIKYGEIISPVQESYHSGSKVKYECPYLFKLQGRKVIKCQGGTWDHPPVCFEPCTTSEETMKINRITLRWGQGKINCVRSQHNGKQAQKCYVKHNGHIKFTCFPGYKISDPRELISRCERGILPYPRCFKM